MMNRYLSIVYSVVFVGLVALPGQASATSITETKAAIGQNCVASGDYSTAMGFNTTASGPGSTAMGYNTIASGGGSTALGDFTIAGGGGSFAGGRCMQLTDTAENTFVWGYSGSAQSISAANAFLIFPAGTSGRVGIGTPSPSCKLHIKGNGWPESFIFLDTHEANQDTGIRFYENASVKGHLYHDAINKVLIFDYEGVSNQIVLHSNGNVGIGIINPSYKLHVNGSAAGTSWTNLSSREYKEDIQTVDKVAYPMMLARLLDMDLTTYKYKKEYGGDGETKLGFIAEDMPEEVLSKDGKGVDLYELLALTIGAIKAQQKENYALRAKLEQVLARLDALKK